jgi:peptide/nickel transport system ATP-binding protein
MLERVRINDPLHCLKAYPHEFSGGMRQRIMLASVLLLKPKLLIADEPTTALDTLSQREVLELMVELARDNGAAVLLITHDLGLVARYTERAIVLQKGRLMESGFTDEILANPQNPYTQRLVASLPRGRADLVPPPASAPTVLQVRQACIEYPGRPGIWRAGVPTQVVHGVSLDVRAAEIVAIVGASGSGKSTLGRAVLGLKPLAAGTISFDGVDLAAMTAAQRRQFRRDAQLVFQDPYSSLDPRRRVRDIVGATLRHIDDLDGGERRARVESILDEVGLSSFGDRFISTSDVRRAATAGGDCASGGLPSATGGCGRARFSSGCHHPAAGSDPVSDSSGAIRLRLPVYHSRPGRRPADSHTGGGDVWRHRGRRGAGGVGLRRSGPPVHARPAGSNTVPACGASAPLSR